VSVVRHRGIAPWASMFLVACATSRPPVQEPVDAPPVAAEPTTTSAPRPTESARKRRASFDKALAAAMIARALPSTGAFASRHVTRSEMDDVVRAQVQRELPPDALEHEEQQEKLLSVIDPSEHYADLVLGMLGSQVAGLYIPREKALYVVDDGAASEGSSEEHTVLVHEIVHAIQDEHFDLGRRVAWRADASDETAAMHALGEGDATLAMLLDTSRGEEIPTTFIDGFTTIMRESNRRMVGERVPTAVADALVDPYVEGLRFVWSLYQRGGWAAVDAAWRDPPRTTEQLLHPEKYAQREAPVALRAEAVGPESFKIIDANTIGELEVRDWLSAFVDFDVAQAIARGWGNGRVELFGRDRERALRLRVRWDSDATAHATQAYARVGAALEKRFGKARRSGPFRCVERPGVGPLSWQVTRGELVVLAGPAIFDETGVRTVSTCTAMRPWAQRAKAAR